MSRSDSRQDNNKWILGLLLDYAEKNPDQRFGQILANSGAVLGSCEQGIIAWANEFYVEPHIVLERMNKKYKEEYYNE